MALEILTDASLRALNTFGVDARARTLLCLRHRDELDAARKALDGQPPFVLGGGSNVLLTRTLDVPVLRVVLRGRAIVRDDRASALVEAAAGEPWHDFVDWTLAQGLYGLENLSLIPGLVGASPIQNIGAYGVEMREHFESLSAWDPVSGERRCFDADACRFGYRDSRFRHAPETRWVVLAVRFRLSREARLRLDYGEIRQELAARGLREPTPRDVAGAVVAIRRRKLPDPSRIGNAGSFFRNPVLDAARAAAIRAEFPDAPMFATAEGQKIAAGWLIERCGWKGYRQGDAGVHATHALVLVNHGRASGAEILALATRIQESVRKRFDIALEPEPRIF